MAERGGRVVEQGNDAPGIVDEPQSLRRQHHTARMALEQGVAEHILELPDLHADRRLGAPDDVCGARDAAGIDNRKKGSEQIAIEGKGHGFNHQIF